MDPSGNFTESRELSQQTKVTRQVQLFECREILARLGKSRNCGTKDLRFCVCHPVESEIFKIKMELVVDGKIQNHVVKRRLMDLPLPQGPKSFSKPAMTVSKGLAADRLLCSVANQITCEHALAHQQSIAMQDINKGEYPIEGINPLVLRSYKLDVHLSTKAKQPCHGRRKRPIKLSIKSRNKMHQKKNNTLARDYAEQPCVVTMSSSVTGARRLLLMEVSSRTGFEDIRELLYYAAVSCGGDFTILTKSVSYLSWLEEWFFFCEMIYGHSGMRWIDFARTYNIHPSILRRVFKHKLSLVIATRKSWPLYATHEEDIMFCKESWNSILGTTEKQNNLRLIMHDNTNVPLVRPSDPDLQRALYSSYYASCVAKGGVSLQLCGWTVTWDLITGGIDDSAYVKKVGILEKQQKFFENDRTCSNPFTNMFDRGYRLILEALLYGKQLSVQPLFAQSDKKFGSDNVIYSAGIATTRSGNERSVRQVKTTSWLIKRGCTFQNWDLEMLSDIWLAWGFQINFMYSPVH